MYAQIPTLIAQAVQLFQQGQLVGAENLLLKVLAAQPRNFDALHILGVIEAMQGQRDKAIELFRKALSLNKNHGFLQFNMAKALSDCDRDEEALIHHRRATQLAPDHAEGWVNFGLSLMKLDQFVPAQNAFQKAVEIQPQYAAAWSNLGLAYLKSARFLDALDALSRATSLQPDLAVAHFNKSVVLAEIGNDADALRSYEHTLQLQPEHAQAWNNKGKLLTKLNRHKDALSCYEQALKITPDSSLYWSNKGAALAELTLHAGAFECYTRALLIDPKNEQAWTNQANSHLALNQIQEAIDAYRNAISINPDNIAAQTSIGQLLLSIGELRLGWEQMELRWLPWSDRPQSVSTARPRWSGTALADIPLLLWGEQGIGDQILYASILPELARLPQRKLVALDKRLLPLFERSMPGFEFIDLATVSDALDFAEQLPLGSLPRLFRPDLASFAAARHPFLQADPARTAALREQIARPGKRVCGVSWSSNRKGLGKHKSISLAQMLAPLACDTLHFVDLQYGDTAAERHQLELEHGIAVQHVDEVDNFNDIDGLAALIQACDIVLTTSNSTAHLAGALGKETWLLLPLGRGRMWYWVEYDGSNPWYPSIHSCPQTEAGKWDDPLRRFSQQLEKHS